MIALLFALLLIQALPEGSPRAAIRHSLSLASFECSANIALDGSAISASDCSGESARAFVLSGPDGQRVELTPALQPAPEGVKDRRAYWSPDPNDDLVDDGSWSLGLAKPQPATADLVTCLKSTGGKFAPAALHVGAGSVEFEWDPAVDLGSATVGGEFLTCSWYTAPPLPIGERPALLTIRIGLGGNPSDADLVVVEPDGEPQPFHNTKPGTVPPTSFTLVGDDSTERFTLISDEAPGSWTTTTFGLSPGDYTLTADATGQSSPLTLEAGQTVLALNTLGHAQEEPSPSSNGELTPTTAAASDLPTATAATADTPGSSTPTAVGLPTVDPPDEVEQVLQFAANDWAGGYPGVVTAVYQRDCVALYGVNSQYPSAVLTFTSGETGDAPATLMLTGLDDEWAGQVPVVVTVNGVVVYQGSSRFNSWDPSAAEVAWNQVSLTFASELLVAGENQIVVTNLADAANFGIPPYLLLAEASLTVSVTSGG